MRSDGNPGQTGDRENPSYVRDILCPLSRVELDLRNPSRPAVFDPHQQAGHKTAPDRDAKLQKSSCNAGTIHTGQSDRLTNAVQAFSALPLKADVAQRAADVCF